jgi:hypothetical protein
VRRLLLLAALSVSAAAVLAAPAGATRECDGLDVCIRVPGPWVAVPAPSRAAPSVAYRLSCPRGSIVGGLDAMRTSRGLDIVFLGLLGSPVNPGITTRRDVVFMATSAARGVTAFRPLLGCIPTSGGGGRRTTSVGAVAPRPAIVRRVRTFKLTTPSQRGTVRCARGERLLSSSHAVAFRTRLPPATRVLSGVRTTLRAGADRVTVMAQRSSTVPLLVRAEVQVHAVCGRAGR